MDDAGAVDDTSISFRTIPEAGEGRPGEVAVELAVAGGQAVSTCEIIPFRIRIGAATVRMDGIGGVGTREEYRRRGLARLVLDAAVARMEAGDAALSMLYGIPDFYGRWGYATAGPGYGIRLEPLSIDTTLPEGWHARAAVDGDLPALERLYALNVQRAVGAAVRIPTVFPWTTLPALPVEPGSEECRLVLRPDGNVAAYLWRGRKFWAAGVMQQEFPDSLILSEVMADGPEAADMALLICRRWAAEEAQMGDKPRTSVTLALPPEGYVAYAAMHESSVFWQRYWRCGDSMARVLHVGRLLDAIKPELQARLQASMPAFRGALRFETDIGSARLSVSNEGLAIEDNVPSERNPPVNAKSMSIRLPQSTLARLALGAFPPRDLLVRLEDPVDERAAEVVEALFPQRLPHMFVPDRY